MRQVESEQLSNTFPVVVNEYLEACRDGRRNGWLASRFDDGYPADFLSNGDVIDDLLSQATSDIGLSVAECAVCGRLWVQCAPGENRYISFVAEEGVPFGILDPDRER